MAGLQRRKARVGQSLASTVLPRLPPCMADSSSVAPDIDSELSEAENRESNTDSTTTSTCTSGDSRGDVAIMRTSLPAAVGDL